MTDSHAPSKAERYEALAADLRLLLADEHEEVSVLANAAGVLAAHFPEWLWTGFYRVEGDATGGVEGAANAEVLLLGPYQGPPACWRIKRGRGVCGTAWERRATIVVPDVDRFPGHIACSSLSRSEIVVPLFDDAGRVRAVLDIDSEHLETFDETDKNGLELAADIIAQAVYSSGKPFSEIEPPHPVA